MELQQLDAEAKKAAIDSIKTMLQRPDQLEKIDQYRHREGRKMASMEMVVKTAMQNQLDGVRSGLMQLESCLSDIKDVDIRIKNINDLIKDVPQIYDSLEHVREENRKHSQYATAMENLKHIFTVQSSVLKTIQWIEEDKLLHAHQCLSDLENSRDDLLFELHKLPKQYAQDKITLKRYFEKVESVSQKLERSLKIIFQRTLNTVRKEPTVIVTALRIVEREEKADQFAIQQQKQTGFMPPGRPKKWRQMVLDTLESSVVLRIEGSKPEERGDSNLWLVKELEIKRQLILEDMRVVKSLCVPCFPPHYDIYNAYVDMYHGVLSNYLEDIISSGLEGNEYVSLLSWVTNTYPGVELMTHPDLNVDMSKRSPLIKYETLKQLEQEYLKTMEKNYTEWMMKTLDTEKQEWQNDSAPDRDQDQDKFYHTAAPVIIFQMIDQHLQVTNTIHAELTFNALVLSIQQVTKYGENYRQGILEFKDKHFKDRSQSPYFTQHIITIINNCQQIIELASQMKQLYWPKTRTQQYEVFEKLVSTYQSLRDEVAAILLDEAFLDLEVHFNELFTTKWLQSNLTVDTICLTLEDYFQDYNHLRVNNFEYVITKAQKMVTRRYIKAMLSKRISRPKEDCSVISKKIIKEAKQIRNFFEVIAPNCTKSDTPIDLISTFATLLTCDIEMLVLDLHSLLGSYPSLSEDQLVRLFYIRNDFKPNEVREKIQDAIKNKKSMVTIDKQDAIFREIVFNDKLWQK